MAASPMSSEGYLDDVLTKPSYRSAWKALISNQKAIPHWLQDYLKSFDGVTMPTTNRKLGPVNYELYEVCKAHACIGNENFFLFLPNHTKAWGAVRVDNGKPVLIGDPNPEQAALLLAPYKTGGNVSDQSRTSQPIGHRNPCPTKTFTGWLPLWLRTPVRPSNGGLKHQHRYSNQRRRLFEMPHRSTTKSRLVGANWLPAIQT